MYSQRALNYPAPGKGRELRAVLEERVKTEQAKGRAITLAMQVFGGAEGNAYTLNIRHQDLASFEAMRGQNQSDPAFGAFQAKIGVLLIRPVVTQLSEVLIPFPANPAPKAPFYVQRALNYPAQGKGPELRALLEERVKGVQSSGQPASLSASVYGSDGPIFITALSFQDLAALESYRRRNQADPRFQAFGVKLNPLVRQVTRVELFEALIAMPS